MMTRARQGLWRILLLTSLALVPAWAQGADFLFAFGSQGTGPGQFLGPSGVAVGPDGKIVVGDEYNNRVQVFDATGKLLFTFGSFGIGKGQFDTPHAVAVGPDGRIAVADVTNRVQMFDPA